ncbi:MAG: ankyrin repeat domain-containing protein [Candidatus Midichloria sp.]|nr:ankyrin repeat domain-containing protein [Candidatus Midichloria sp.]
MFKNFFGWGESAKSTSEVRVNNPSQSVSADARGGIPQSTAAAGSSKVSQSYDYKDFRPSNTPVGILIKNRGGVLDENMKLLNSLIDEELAGNQEKITNSLSKALSNGAIINYQNNFGKTALHLAVHNGYDRVVEWLIKNGADLHIGNHLGDTALSFAVQGAL